MHWTGYFKGNILERGRKYYKNGLVFDVEEKNGMYCAEVIGSEPYSVAVWKKPNNRLGFTCNCPHALEGNHCKHMAALCYELGDKMDELSAEKTMNSTVTKKKAAVIKKDFSLKAENETKAKAKQSEIIKPFSKKNQPGEEYFYYDLSFITEGFTFYEDKISEAKRLINAKKVSIDDVSCYHTGSLGQGEKHLCARGKYISEYGYASRVEVVISNKEIVRASCEVANCYRHYDNRYGYGKKELCIHQLALLILLAAYIDKNNPGDSTDYETLQLISYFENKHRKEVVGNVLNITENLHFEPRLEMGWNDLMVSFKLGKDKTFVVKDLTELVDNIDKGKVQQFGKNTQFHYSLDKICSQDLPYYQFVENIVKRRREEEMQLRMNHSYSNSLEKIKDRIVLSGENLDKFFSVALENTRAVSYEDKGKNSKISNLLFQERNPKVVFTIKILVENNVFQGVCVAGQLPELVSGREYLYFMEGNSLCRISEEMGQILKPIYENASSGNVAFKVGRKSLAGFYYHTLPYLAEYVDIVEEGREILEKYLPKKAEFSFYLDVKEESLFCKTMVNYGEEEYVLSESETVGSYKWTLRDRMTEEEVLLRLKQYFEEERDGYMCCCNYEDFLTVLEEAVPTLAQYGEVYCSEAVKRMRFRNNPKVKVGVSLESNLLNLEISAEDIDANELLNILSSYRRKKKYYLLKSGEFLNLEDENIRMLSGMMDTLHISDKEFLKGNIKIPAYRSLYLDKVLEKNECLYVERDRHYKQLIKEFKTVEDSDFEVPAELTNVLRNYQMDGYKWLRTLSAYGFGGILADDMGLGKTLQMIAVLLAKKQEGIEGTSLIVCPASLVFNWQEEFYRFAPELLICTVTGNQGEREEIIEDYKKYDVIITSYDLLKRDIGYYEDKSFYYQIIDEAQYIKTNTTAAAKAVKAVNSLYKYALTGTPIENRLSELWSIFDYLMPGFLYSYEVFKRELETPIAKYKEEAVALRLKKMVAPFIKRRLKQDVLKDLPDKIEEIHYAKFSGEQQTLYDAQVVHMRTMLDSQSEEEYNQGKIAILAELTKLRQICCDPDLLFENYRGESAKREACMELMKSAIEGEHRILLFSQFTSMLALLEESLKKEGIPFYKITGSTPKEERIRLVKLFNEGDVPVFLISLKAGGTGLNLTGADVVIHYDPWWNLAAQNQATDRAHRIGQEKIVTVYKLIAKNTIEEKIVELQQAKKDLADAILSGEMGSLGALSREELLAIL